MLLAVDIGNSNIVLAIWDGDQWKNTARVETHPVMHKEEYKRKLAAFLEKSTVEPGGIDSAIISSVVPNVTTLVSASIVQVTKIDPIVLNAQTDTGIRLGAEHPERVGADLIADAAGAYALTKNACIVVDFGTATTVMAVEKEGVLAGGAICAGLKVSIESLVGKTAQLPDIPLEIPPSPIGKNTVQAMQSGLVLGHLCMVEGLIERQKKELGAAEVVATGGLVSLLAPHTNHFDYVEPMLTLDGLRIIAERQDLK